MHFSFIIWSLTIIEILSTIHVVPMTSWRNLSRCSHLLFDFVCVMSSHLISLLEKFTFKKNADSMKDSDSKFIVPRPGTEYLKRSLKLQWCVAAERFAGIFYTNV